MTDSDATTRPGDPTPACRFCRAPLRTTVVDLGMSPLCESFPAADEVNRMEPFYPLHVYVCEQCWLVQVEEYVDPDGLFATGYRYYSSYSASWLEHARRYAQAITTELGLGPDHLVVELGSNDGYLLQYVAEAGVPVLGIEPADEIAAAANAAGVRTVCGFFGREAAARLVEEGHRADLVVGNNVLAQVPDLNDFVAGVALLLAPGGTVTMEFPHLIELIEANQYDTIYHEHFSYFSLHTVSEVFAAHGMTVFDVEQLPTHGGSLRIRARHREAAPALSERAEALLAHEDVLGVRTVAYYASFAARVDATKRRLLEFLIDAKDGGRSVVGYGAPGKGNTLLNHCGIRTDLLAYTVDRNPHKHGRVTPGTHIPIHPPDRLAQTRPDYVLILPWNLREEIVASMSHVRDWGGRFVVAIPELSVV